MLTKLGQLRQHIKNYIGGDTVDEFERLAIAKAEKAAASEMREKCLETASVQFASALRDGCDSHGAHKIAMDFMREIPIPTSALDLALKRARLEEAKWWRHLVIMDEASYFAVEGDKHIVALNAEVSALEQAQREGWNESEI
jgi:hypothetical protein